MKDSPFLLKLKLYPLAVNFRGGEERMNRIQVFLDRPGGIEL
jgi:hypothetical protein